jgi:hypothetical protein
MRVAMDAARRVSVALVLMTIVVRMVVIMVTMVVIVMRMRMRLIVSMAVPRPVRMHVLVRIMHAGDLGGRAGLQVQQGGFRIACTTTCPTHHMASSSSMLLTFNSSPASR